MIMPIFVLQVVSGLASPIIFLPSFVLGWLSRRWWHLPLAAVVVGLLSDAEVMLIELPGGNPDWTSEPFGFIAPAAWCGAGFLAHIWCRRTGQLRCGRPRLWPVVAGMALGALVVAALALGVGLFYLQQGELEFHTMGFGQAVEADYETIFFQYLFPGLLLGQLAGGLIGRVLAPRPASVCA
jgi:hypothetical protein